MKPLPAITWKREPITAGRVYRNLTNGLLSIMGSDGLVHGHFAQVMLHAVRFHVSASILAKIRATNRKTVGMWAKGTIHTVGNVISLPIECAEWERITFDPYKVDGFTNERGEVVTTAARLLITSAGLMLADSAA